MTRLGIIPAGGQALRFGGTLKEMLPCKENTLLERAVMAMNTGYADDVVVITTPEKIGIHAAQLKNRNVWYRLALGSLWASLEDVMRIEYDQYMFAMPDTYFPGDCFDDDHEGDFRLGVFKTNTPSRFGVVHEDVIWDKYFDAGEYEAYGVVLWSSKVADFWAENSSKIRTHTDAFNLAMDEFGFELFNLDYYYDMASFDDYRKLVKDVI